MPIEYAVASNPNDEEGSLPLETILTVVYAGHKFAPTEYHQIAIGGTSMQVTIPAGKNPKPYYDRAYDFLKAQAEERIAHDIADFWRWHFQVKQVPGGVPLAPLAPPPPRQPTGVMPSLTLPQAGE
jgi:hypothetical protein